MKALNIIRLQTTLRLLVLTATIFLTLVSGASAQIQCPCSIWSSSAVPVNQAFNDESEVEVGVKFRSDTVGFITGIRFYKGVGNSGTHVGSLWRSDGTLVATAVFSNETASGWQQVNFATPVAIDASTVYIASYHAPQGRYAGDNFYFSSQDVDNGPLHAVTDGVGGGNGVYVYGPQGTFPNFSYRATNYWVDVVFTTQVQVPQETLKPILIITSPSNPFSLYYQEILLAEGLNEFATITLDDVTPTLLSQYDLAILGEMPLSLTQVTILTDWVNAGGNLIAMRPDKNLAGLLGLVDVGNTLADGYLLVDTTSGPGKGIVGQTIQYHASADLYTLNGATPVATLYSDAVTATAYPAVTKRTVGNSGGQVGGFLFDLAKSVVYTRQGNPSWAGQERDGIPAVRANDLFFPDYINLNKVAIPQADEQQRLLANMIIQMNLRNKPLPRFWYLPKGLKAAVVHALDDHNTSSGTKDTFAKLVAESPVGCSVADWECFRATAWVYLGIPVTDAEANDYNSHGFELGIHAQNGCTVNFTSFADLFPYYSDQLQSFQSAYPSLPPQRTSRFHCIVWSDWVTQARVQLANGIRYSMDYYYYPGSWIQGRPGFFTGSGFPMKFADTNGETVDVYQGVSQLVNENGLSYPSATNTMLDKALGAEGYYGLFGTHDDYRDTAFLKSIISSATSRNVPIISAEQALAWLDGRDGSSMSSFSWNGTSLRFTVAAGAGARNLQGMLPINSTTNSLTSITKDGASVPFLTTTIKGVTYATFPASTGVYTTAYGGAIVEPTPNAPNGQTLWVPSTIPSITSFSGDSNSVELGVKFQSQKKGKITGIRFFKGTGNTGTHVGNLWTEDGTLLASVTFSNETSSGWQIATFSTPVTIQANTNYVASYVAPHGNYAVDYDYFVNQYSNGSLVALASNSSGGNGLYTYGSGGFPSSTYRSTNYWVDVVFEETLPQTLWTSTTVPTIASFTGDSSPIELGVKFQSQNGGEATGIRFYKGPSNTGIHIGNLWSSTGTLLASAVFTDESASGWQEATFAAPVTIQPNVTYIASYFAPNGNYAVDYEYFTSDYLNGGLRALAAGASGGNGLYFYSSSGGFPINSYRNTNYWVDVVVR